MTILNILLKCMLHSRRNRSFYWTSDMYWTNQLSINSCQFPSCLLPTLTAFPYYMSLTKVQMFKHKQNMAIFMNHNRSFHCFLFKWTQIKIHYKCFCSLVKVQNNQISKEECYSLNKSYFLMSLPFHYLSFRAMFMSGFLNVKHMSFLFFFLEQ